MAREPIDDEVELQWSGPGTTLIRPMTYGTLRRLVDACCGLFVLAGIAATPVAAEWVHVDGVRPTLGLIPVVGTFVAAAAFPIAIRLMRRETIEWSILVLTAIGQIGAIALATVAVVAAGPQLGVVAIYYVETPLVAFMFYRTKWALVVTACIVVGYSLALWIIDGDAAPVEQVLIVVTAAIATGFLVGDLARRSEEAQRAERIARNELADLNQHLEARVEEQVDELERTGRLRRFLAPQVADLVMTAANDDSLLQPHRQDVAVLFCDLRGFTRFTNSVPPEVVVSVLGEYYAAVGAVLESHRATIGGYEGDGIMAYLGDPIPRADAAEAGVATARAIGEALDGLVARWRSTDYELSYGIGLAFGPATLGVVGFDGRFDYTALGAVVNLAARLCSDALPGEIVVDDSLHEVAGGAGGVRHRGDVTLKGFDAVATYTLVR